MKTFTLRLTDDEAEALTRLAYIAGKSKNNYITGLIAAEYSKREPDAVDGSKIIKISKEFKVLRYKPLGKLVKRD